MCGLHGIALALAVFTPVLQETPFEAFGMTALAVPYLLHQAGLPVLHNDGPSGWGMPSPNVLGWLLSAVVWLALYWLIARVFGHLTRH